jgi:hypothetical protein
MARMTVIVISDSAMIPMPIQMNLSRKSRMGDIMKAVFFSWGAAATR